MPSQDVMGCQSCSCQPNTLSGNSCINYHAGLIEHRPSIEVHVLNAGDGQPMGPILAIIQVQEIVVGEVFDIL